MRLSRISAAGVLAAALGLAPAARAEDMTFFVTSVGKGKGGDLGGLEGADAHCSSLAKAAGSKHASWRAYLSTFLPGGDAGVSARDRIGKGPWYNAKGVMIAKDVEDLHSDRNHLTKQTALTEKGEVVPGRGDPVNMHDILTARIRRGASPPRAAIPPAATGRGASTARRSWATATAPA